MHILFLTENFPPETNAAATRVYERACYWVRWGHEVTVLTCAPNFPQGRLYAGYTNAWYRLEAMDGIRVVRVKTFIAANEGFLRRTLDFLSFVPTSVTAGLFQKRPDVVVATSPQFFAAVAGWLLAAVRRRPFVFELGDLWPASIAAVGVMRKGLMYRALEAMELFLYRRAAAVISLTRAFKADLVSRGIPAEKIAVIRNGVDLPRYGPRQRDPVLAERFGLRGKFVVGYIGTHGMAHGLEHVLQAADSLRERDDIRFLFVGAGAARDSLIREAERLQLSNCVLVPAQPKDHMPAYWSLCDVALVHLKATPVFETVIPSKIFEAMGMGLPILLAGPAGEARDVVWEADAGVWVLPERPALLADAVLRLHDDAGERARLMQNALNAAPRFSREEQARLVLATLGQVAGTGIARGPS